MYKPGKLPDLKHDLFVRNSVTKKHQSAIWMLGAHITLKFIN